MSDPLRVRVTVDKHGPLFLLLWRSIPDLECPNGEPIHATILGVGGVWRVRAWAFVENPLGCEFELLETGA